MSGRSGARVGAGLRGRGRVAGVLRGGHPVFPSGGVAVRWDRAASLSATLCGPMTTSDTRWPRGPDATSVRSPDILDRSKQYGPGHTRSGRTVGGMRAAVLVVLVALVALAGCAGRTVVVRLLSGIARLLGCSRGLADDPAPVVALRWSRPGGSPPPGGPTRRALDPRAGPPWRARRAVRRHARRPPRHRDPGRRRPRRPARQRWPRRPRWPRQLPGHRPPHVVDPTVRRPASAAPGARVVVETRTHRLVYEITRTRWTSFRRPPRCAPSPPPSPAIRAALRPAR